MKRWGVLFAIGACALASRAAHADEPGDDRFEIGASFVVASTAASMNSGGELGGAATAARWFGPIAIVGEAGAHEWQPDGIARWFGAGVRAAHTFRFRFHDTDGAGWIRLWGETGLADKAWHLRDAPVGADAWYSGPRAHLGGGFDWGGGDDRRSGGTKWSMGMSVWFRVEWGGAPDLNAGPPGGRSAWFGEDIPREDYVMGMAFLFGGPA